MKKNIVLYICSCLIVQALWGQRDIQYPASHVEEWKKMNASKRSTFDWFTGAKYGMFIHWGLYSIPGGIWKGKRMEEMDGPPIAEWIMLGAKILRSEYAELAGQFNPVKFNADSIADLARDAGMKYVVITAKHHDGFAMYDSDVNDFNVVDASPFKRDVVKELYVACLKRGLEFGVYYSQNIDWMHGADAQAAEAMADDVDIGISNKSFGANTWDPSPNSYEEYLEDKAYPQVKELMQKFPGMKCLWFDMPWRLKPYQSYKFYRIAYEVQPQVIITNRIGNDFGDYDIPGDNRIPEDPDLISKPWETVGTLNNSWGYKSYDSDWKSPKELLFWLIEIVSKGGNYMLNIGPTAEGVVPEQSEKSLRAVGRWLKVNGESIYGTTTWDISHEGPTGIKMKSTSERAEKGFLASFTNKDFWFTKKDSVLYAISIEKPQERAIIRLLNSDVGKIRKVEILGMGAVHYKQTHRGMIVKIPERFRPEYGFVIKAIF